MIVFRLCLACLPGGHPFTNLWQSITQNSFSMLSSLSIKTSSRTKGYNLKEGWARVCSLTPFVPWPRAEYEASTNKCRYVENNSTCEETYGIVTLSHTLFHERMRWVEGHAFTHTNSLAWWEKQEKIGSPNRFSYQHCHNYSVLSTWFLVVKG